MLEDSIADLTCAIEQNGWANDTVTILVSDNGGSTRGKIARDTRERGTFTAHCFCRFVYTSLGDELAAPGKQGRNVGRYVCMFFVFVFTIACLVPLPLPAHSIIVLLLCGQVRSV